jgi:uncharacterized membrane protein
MNPARKKKIRKKSAWGTILRLFLKGLATLLPTILTVYIIFFAYGFLRDYVAGPVNQLIGYSFANYEWGQRILTDQYEIDKVFFTLVKSETTKGIKEEYYFEAVPQAGEEFKDAIRKNIVLPGFVIAILGIFFIGIFAASFIGRRLWRMIERLIVTIPFVKTIYPYAKQVTEFVFGESQVEFSHVVAIEYPRMGIWQLGFVTGHGLLELKDHTGKKMLNVFVPSAPTPVTGYVVFVCVDEVIFLDMTVEEVLPLIISGGVVVPEQQMTPEGLEKFRERTSALQIEKLKEMVEKRLPGTVFDKPADAEPGKLPPPQAPGSSEQPGQAPKNPFDQIDRKDEEKE